MQVDIIGTQPHYLDHTLPILEALPDDVRGVAHPLGKLTRRPNTVALVAGMSDAWTVRADGPVIYVEHGAGQTYGGDPDDMGARQSPGYSLEGGGRYKHVIGFVCPSQRVADNWTSAPSVAVGCPKMDRYISDAWSPTKTVCITFHWDAHVCPESRWAWPHYAVYLSLVRLAWERQGYRVFGHAHPRVAEVLEPIMHRCGLQFLQRDEDVFNEAAILVADNTSLGPEFASLGRPVVWMNAPWYRRHIEHGGRFWTWAQGGYTVDGPHELEHLDLASIEANPEPSTFMALDAYEHIDGKASHRAAMWIADLVRGLGSRP